MLAKNMAPEGATSQGRETFSLFEDLVILHVNLPEPKPVPPYLIPESAERGI
jgi:hypothetical protein